MSASTTELDTQTLEKAAQLEVYNEKGEKVKFGSIFKDKKTVVVFIRHFFCGICKQYVSQISSTVRGEALQAANTDIVLVGCGEWELIKEYKEDTGFEGNVYANPDRSLYSAFGMVENLKQTPSGQPKASYITQSVWKTTLEATKHTLFHITQFSKSGNISQNGGELVLGPGLECSFFHRMVHTQDHAELTDIMRAAGVAYP
ncbi:unnamed protein product [Peniophora sp. CBMAI 1063]|nr:unnamed protein product [Peniophora sp. CBMAI 1063]